MTTSPDEVELCPYCERTSGVKVITETSPTVRAWRCGDCGTDWAITVVNPPLRPLLDQLAVDVLARSVLRELTTLAEHADTLTDGKLRARLLGCWARLTQVCRHGATPLGRKEPRHGPHLSR